MVGLNRASGEDLGREYEDEQEESHDRTKKRGRRYAFMWVGSWRRGSALRGYLSDDDSVTPACYIFSDGRNLRGWTVWASIQNMRTIDSFIVLLALSCLTRCAFSCRSSDDSDDDDDEDDDEAVKVVSRSCNVHRIACHCRLRACHGWVLACVFIYSPCSSCHNHDSGWLLTFCVNGGQRALRAMVLFWQAYSFLR